MPPGAMCWKQISKIQKILFIIFVYLIAHKILSLVLNFLILSSEIKVNSYISGEMYVGDRYVVMFLVAPKTPVFKDKEGADVFTTRNCGNCFITNNQGFLPLSEYDAILVHGNRSLLSETTAFMNPWKMYVLEAKDQCLRRKLKYCIHEPRITSLSTKNSYDLCGLCRSLRSKRC